MTVRRAAWLVIVACGLCLWAAGPAQGAGRRPGAFSFVVFGDNQFSIASPTSGVPERMAVPKVVLALEPDFVLHTGDLMDHGYEPNAYARFVEFYGDMLAKLPLFPTLGNHDAARGATPRYKAYLTEQLRTRNPRVGGRPFRAGLRLWYGDDRTRYSQSFKDPARSKFQPDLPSGVSFKTFYAFRFRNVVVLSLEQGTRWWANTPRSWIEKHLKGARAARGVDHIFVIMHHPMYSTTMREGPASGECIEPVRKLYEPLFRQYDVTIVFSGHAHLYDRFYVPDDDTPTRREPPPAVYAHDGRAVHYIVTGGGGGPLNRGGWAKEHSYAFFQKRICAYHVTEVQVDGKRLQVNVHLVKGSAASPGRELFDSFRIEPPTQRKP